MTSRYRSVLARTLVAAGVAVVLLVAALAAILALGDMMGLLEFDLILR